MVTVALFFSSSFTILKKEMFILYCFSFELSCVVQSRYSFVEMLVVARRALFELLSPSSQKNSQISCITSWSLFLVLGELQFCIKDIGQFHSVFLLRVSLVLASYPVCCLRV